ncbi:MAG TPA: hypothetical protein VFX20_13215 [Steroidobacteraceae bacterium]|nr:hypothetical protein [Steroidobacteraceae bacterium]
MGNRRLRDIFSAPESAEPGYRAEAIDEYRELALLANAWERQALERGVEEGAPGRIDDAEGKEPAVR